MNEVGVSVLLPYRDAAPTLGEALGSVLAQEGVALEVLAIDDGSRDEGPRLVAALAAQDPRVRAIESPVPGLVAALEHGRALARGRWIARMDADDVSLPGRFAAQREALEAMPRVAALGTEVEGFPAEAIGAGLAAYVAWQNGLHSCAEHARDLFVEAPLCHPSVMLRREALDAVAGWRDVGWPEDYDLWLRLDAAGFGLAKLPRVLLLWRHHEGRATFSDPRYARPRILAARAAFLALRLAPCARPLVLWGAGKTGLHLARALAAHGVTPDLFIDIDPAKIGRTRRGVPVRSPEALTPGHGHVLVAVGARGARAEVRARLEAAGFVETRDFTCAA